MINNYDFKKIGERIKDERKKAGYKSQQKFAEEINVSRQTLSKWERGDDTTEASINDYLHMCNIFGCELGYLLCEYDCKTRAATDINKETGLSEKAIEELRVCKTILGPDFIELLNLLIIDSNFAYALSDVLCAQEWYADIVHKGGASMDGVFLVSTLRGYSRLPYTDREQLRQKDRRDAVAFYMQEAQSLFRKAAEAAINNMTNKTGIREYRAKGGNNG